jgi:integrase
VQAISERGWYHDKGGQRGLYLQVSRDGTKSWAYRYRINGRERWMGLGSCDKVSLALARELAKERQEQCARGIDPIDARDAREAAARLEAARRTTFGQCVESFLQFKSAEWTSPKHVRQWEMTLRQYAKPLHAFDPATIDLAMVVKVLQPLWAKAPETGSRLRQRIESVLDHWSVKFQIAGYSNPASWERVKHALPAVAKLKKQKRKQKPQQQQNGNGEHHAALPYEQMPQFMEELRSRREPSARALEFLVLTGTRTSEVTGAAWNEIDLKTAAWIIPAGRMKADKAHKIPLSSRALEILRQLPQDTPPFPLGDRAMARVLKRLRPGVPATIHGMRSSFRDWAAETTNFPNHVAEMALAHSIGSKVEASYRRGDLFARRRKLMDAWAAYCTRPATGGNVVALRG